LTALSLETFLGKYVGMPDTQLQTLVVLCTCSSQEEARRISQNLVEGRLAACVNVLPGIESIYRWNDAVETANEVLLVIKTSSDRFAALESRILELHSYDVPEILALPAIGGSAPYLAWLHAQLR
jgi:periplasmic divalent cation tolerance protein